MTDKECAWQGESAPYFNPAISAQCKVFASTWNQWAGSLFATVLVSLLALILFPAMGFTQASNTLQENIPGSLLVFPIFDVIGTNQTKIRITNNGASSVSVHLNYICQPLGTSSFCPLFDETQPLTSHQTIVLDVGTQLGGNCPTGQGFIVAWAEAQCPSSTPLPGCNRTNGDIVAPGEFAPISFNQLFGSYQLFYNGSTNPPTLTCGDVPCSPPVAGSFPTVATADAIAIQSPHPVFSFIGIDAGGVASLNFGTATAFDYVALPKVIQTDFAAPRAPLIAGPPDFPPSINPDTASGTEVQTNMILLNLNFNQVGPNSPVVMSVNVWNWHEVGFTSTHRYLCWERIGIEHIDSRLLAAGPFGAPYGNIRLTPVKGTVIPFSSLGVLEEVTTNGRTIKPTSHASVQAISIFGYPWGTGGDLPCSCLRDAINPDLNPTPDLVSISVFGCQRCTWQGKCLPNQCQNP